MRWGLRSSKQQQQREALQPVEQERPRQQESKGKNKAIFSSFFPLAWLSKLTAKNGGAAAARPPVHATSAAKSAAQGTTASPSCFHKPTTSPGPAASASASRSSLADSSSSAAEAADDIVPRRDDDDTGGTAAEIAPRRRSVGNDEIGPEAAAARQLCRRRHYSVGGDRDLPPLGHLSAFPKAAPPTPAPVRLLPPLPSDTDEEKRPPRSRRRQHHRRVVSGRRSFSSAKAPGGGARLSSPAVRVRSPRPSSAAAAAVSELERFAVVRRTRHPQREFRASMVEMIASKRMVGRPEELETLLACYLSLNADEHHDCIVKVFRQVWFELNNTTSARATATATAPAART